MTLKNQKFCNRAISTNLVALRAILDQVVEDTDHALEAIGRGYRDRAVGSIMPSEELLKQASTLVAAIVVMHRYN